MEARPSFQKVEERPHAEPIAPLPLMESQQQSEMMRMQRMKMMRAAQLQLEVAALARLSNPGMGMGGFPSLVGGSSLAGSSSVRGGSFGGPTRREPERGRSSSKPYDRPRPANIAGHVASRTNSTVSCVSPFEADSAPEVSISPLSSPALEASVSLLSTPELFGLLGNDRLPPSLALESAAKPAKPTSSANGRSSPSPEAAEPRPPSATCPSPSPSTGQIVGRAGRASPTPERKPVHDFLAEANGKGSLMDASPKKGSAADGPSSSSYTCFDMLNF